jgi:hypothetical protein
MKKGSVSIAAGSPSGEKPTGQPEELKMLRLTGWNGTTKISYPPALISISRSKSASSSAGTAALSNLLSSSVGGYRPRIGSTRPHEPPRRYL